MPARKDMGTIKRIFDMRSEGMGIKTIARLLKIHPITARQYCYLADKLMSLEPDKVEEAVAELSKYRPMSLADIKRKRGLSKIQKFLDFTKNTFGKIIEALGENKNGRKGRISEAKTPK